MTNVPSQFVIETGKPIPEHGKRGAKRGPRRKDFQRYLDNAREGLRTKAYAGHEEAAYQIAKSANRDDGVDFSSLKSFLRYHLDPKRSA